MSNPWKGTLAIGHPFLSSQRPKGQSGRHGAVLEYFRSGLPSAMPNWGVPRRCQEHPFPSWHETRELLSANSLLIAQCLSLILQCFQGTIGATSHDSLFGGEGPMHSKTLREQLTGKSKLVEPHRDVVEH